MMPWFWILVAIVGVYLVVKIVQGIRDFAAWIVESRELAKLREEARERHRQGRPVNPPPLKERPASTTKPPKRRP